jgi:hypothetical protein
MRGVALASVTVWAAIGVCAEAPKEPDPKNSAIYPAAGRVGGSFAAVIRGADLAHARAVVFEGSGLECAVLGTGAEQGKEVRVKFSVAADARTGLHDFRLVTSHGVSNKIGLDVLAGPVVEEAAVSGPLAQFPITIAGRLAQPGETDAYWIEVARGATLTFEAVSRVNGFDPAVAL